MIPLGRTLGGDAVMLGKGVVQQGKEWSKGELNIYEEGE